VSKLYTVTELYMLQDKSDNKEATWEFLDRRLDEVMIIGKTLN
jgi:ubiquinone biosynthesis protein COQ9